MTPLVKQKISKVENAGAKPPPKDQDKSKAGKIAGVKKGPIKKTKEPPESEPRTGIAVQLRL